MMQLSCPVLDLSWLAPFAEAAPEMTLADAAAQMLTVSAGVGSEFPSANQPRCLVVQAQGQIVGILTQPDLLRILLQQDRWKALSLGQCMSQPVITLPLSSLSNSGRGQELLERHGIGHLPIVDEQGHCVGILTPHCLHRFRDSYRLWESEQRYQAVVASAPVGIFRNDAAGNCILVNARCLELLGFTEDRLLGEQWQTALHPDDREEVIEAWYGAVEAAQCFQGEYRCLHPDGQVKWVYTQAIPEIDSQGRLLGYCGTLTDISDRKKTEEALLESEARLRSITDSIPGCIAYVDAFQRYQFTNQTYRTWLNYPQAEIVGQKVEEVLGERRYEQCKSRIERVLQGEKVAYETMVSSDDGTVRYLSGMLVPDLDSQNVIQGYFALLTDISDRKRAEQALQASEAKKQAILATIPDYLFCVDDQGCYREIVNYRKGITIFAENFNPIGMTMVDVLPVEIAAQQMHYLQQAFLTGELQTYEQVLNLNDSERVRHEEVRVIRSAHDEALFMVRDITERKRIEQQIQNLLAGTAAETGKDFFPVLATHLAEALQVDYALVAELRNDNKLYSLAFWADGALRPPVHYGPGETLWELAMEHGQHQADGRLAYFCNEFPGLLSDLSANSYLGIPLRNSDDAVIGILCVMDRLSISHCHRVEGILRVFAARAAAELERQRASALLEQLNQELEHKVEERTAELRERKQFLHTVLDAFPLSIFWKNLNSVYLGANRRFLYDAGLESTNELVGKTDYDLVWGKTEAEAYRADDQEVIRSKKAKSDIIESQLQATGKRVWIETNKMPLCNANGELLGVLGTYHDVTDRQKTEKRLRQLTDRLDLAVSSAGIGIWEFDISTSSLLWDQRMYELYDLQPEQLPVDCVIWNNCLHPEDQESAKRIFYDAARGERDYDAEFRVIRPDKSIRFLKASALLQHDVEGKPHKMIGVNYDVSSQKEAEIRLLKMNQELARATRLKDEFLANMSHELRTPLNAILGMAEGLREQVFGNLNERQLDALKIVQRSGSHLLELINDVLDVAKIEAGQVKLNYDAVEIYGLCQSSITFVTQQAAKKQIDIKLEGDTEWPLLYLDGRRIRQVLVNLLANAVKFTPEQGSIKLSLRRELGIDLRAGFHSKQIDVLRLEISDTGIGIAAENLAQLFEPFVQIDSSLNRQYEGTGLGLALVKIISELHGGQVSVTSEVGVGSCFTVDIPYILATSMSVSSLRETLSGTTLSGGLLSAETKHPKILLAEDNEANVKTITSYLAAKGYQLLIAKTGQRAVDLASLERPDLILMDIQMPGMDGLEAIREIRLLPGFAELPIIALTALAMPGDRERCMLAGANEYMTKPVKLNKLVGVMQQLLDKLRSKSPADD